ncbi:MAG: DUF1080 domain-containing protein [Planctomycetes bacterium]|nr:DUF1080 domain-containing protein [Planctomycetota bacterium]
MIRMLVPALLVALSWSQFASAEDKNTDLALDPAKAGPDFAIQGEYEAAPADKLGVQVIALGGGTFRVCIEAGGLPGAGWDGMGKVQLEGKAEGGKVAVNGKGWNLTLDDGGVTAIDDTDKRTVQLKKVLRQSPTMGAKPPEGAIVLFDGSNVDAWNGSMDDRKLLKYGATTKQKFGSFTLHLEFILPFKPYGRGQDRGNSGLYLQERYECQVLDSFGLNGENNECGGIYTIAKPQVNMCFPPLSWQTYDVDFTAAAWADGKKTANAKVTIRHNGVVIHQDQELPKPTGGGKPESAEPGGLHLQDHGNPTFYRNIWLLEKK